MPKKIVSFALSEQSAEKMDSTSKALGMTRSELLEFLISKGFRFSEDVKNDLDDICKKQEAAKEKIGKGKP
jgi:site-specific recombinase XerD